MSRLVVALGKSIFLLFYSLKFLSFFNWLKFWFTSSPEYIVPLDNLKIAIRAQNLKSKIVDLYMAVGCILWKQYDQETGPPTGTVIDIGGHIGSYCLYASKSAKRVITFEPDPANFIQIIRNLELNNASNIKAINMGVAGQTGEKMLFANTNNSAAHSMVHKNSGLAKSVLCLNLNDVFDNERINICDFMKPDCEGAEFDILTNTPQSILERIKCISMEYHEGYDLSELISFLIKSGFKITKNYKENSYQGQIWAKR